MADEEDRFFIWISFVMLLYTMQPVEVTSFPFTALTFQWRSGPTGGQIDVKRKVWDLLFEPDIKFFPVERNAFFLLP
jgi:hypothetical protein